MKISNILTIPIALLWLAGSASSSPAQDALNQLNADNNQGVVDQNDAAAAAAASNKAISDDKIKATMSTKEFENFASAQAYVDQNSTYTLGPDDVISIIVMRHPEVSGEYTINKQGKIQYEFAGDVILAGLTKEQAIKTLSEKLSPYIIKPEISVKITGYNSKIVFVVGEVARPGRVAMHGDTITVRDALLEAGLPLVGSAATDSASIFTPDASGKVVRKKVNVEALLYRGDLRENYIMNPGDCLYIPATFLTKAMRAINPVAQPVESAAGAAGAAAAI